MSENVATEQFTLDITLRYIDYLLSSYTIRLLLYNNMIFGCILRCFINQINAFYAWIFYLIFERLVG
jgi:hypothetical protein